MTEMPGRSPANSATTPEISTKITQISGVPAAFSVRNDRGFGRAMGELFALSGREPVRDATRACSVWLGKPHRSGSLHGAMDCCCLAGGTRHITRRAWNRALRAIELTQKFHQNSRNFRGILRNFRGASRGLPCGSPPLSLLIVALAGPFVWLPALP